VLRATRKTLTPVRLRAVLPRPVLGVSLRPQAKSLQEPTACVDLVRAYWELSPKARRRADGCRDLYRTPRSRTGIMGSVQCAAQRIGECDASLPPELGLAHGDMLTPREGATGPACRAARPSPTILSDLIRRGAATVIRLGELMMTKLRSGSVEEMWCPYWARPACRCRWRASLRRHQWHERGSASADRPSQSANDTASRGNHRRELGYIPSLRKGEHAAAAHAVRRWLWRVRGGFILQCAGV
jgi:hypothetical protein